jgi:hypothetical protein
MAQNFVELGAYVLRNVRPEIDQLGYVLAFLYSFEISR